MDAPEHGSEPALDLRGALEVADWRRRIAELYARVRSAADPAQGWDDWCATRAALFAGHPQSPLPAPGRTADRMPRYFPYDPAYRVLAEVEPVPDGTTIRLAGSAGETFTVVRVGVATFTLGGIACRLGVHWLTEYSGGVFVAFRDAGSGEVTWGTGRYLLDSAKGADLGVEGGRLVLDFNFAYQPSCSYDSCWSCPLPPPDSTLPVRVEAGERSD